MIDILYVLINMASHDPVMIFSENKQCLEAVEILKKELDVNYKCHSVMKY